MGSYKVHVYSRSVPYRNHDQRSLSLEKKRAAPAQTLIRRFYGWENVVPKERTVYRRCKAVWIFPIQQHRNNDIEMRNISVASPTAIIQHQGPPFCQLKCRQRSASVVASPSVWKLQKQRGGTVSLQLWSTSINCIIAVVRWTYTLHSISSYIYGPMSVTAQVTCNTVPKLHDCCV